QPRGSGPLGRLHNQRRIHSREIRPVAGLASGIRLKGQRQPSRQLEAATAIRYAADCYLVSPTIARLWARQAPNLKDWRRQHAISDRTPVLPALDSFGHRAEAHREPL